MKSPPIALALGLGFGLGFSNPYAKQTRSLSKTLLQASVVGLGFGMNLRDVLRAGSSGFLYTAVGIAVTLMAGVALGRLLKVERTPALLISVGTAICGGSAIAAVGPVVGADEEEMSVSLGAVFILNSIALLIFPVIGHSFSLSQEQFGLWAALAIHDTSSVVGAAAKYGAAALAVGATVKLARALWIAPLAVGTAFLKRREARIQWPWFILFFCVASVIRTGVPAGRETFDILTEVARLGLTVTLFLIGCGISKKTLRAVGVRPLAQGVILWVIVGALSLALIRAGVIGL
ncbi:MAG TPA: putative sulfate exporter family transporter [Blastocatellia bacterium]|nr:putative sulfate exporter family transporter [Blastocatellia bacterium]